MSTVKFYNDDCTKFSEDNACQFDSVVTDPPYGIEYLGNSWDTYKGCVAFKEETWKSIAKSLKPGGYLVIF